MKKYAYALQSGHPSRSVSRCFSLQVKVHVAVKERVGEIRLRGALARCHAIRKCPSHVVPGMSAECLPSSTATDKLAGLKAKLKKLAQGADPPVKPFPYMEVSEFLPSWATIGSALDLEGLANPELQPKAKRRLDMVRWIAAYQNLQLAEAANELWDYTASAAHLRNCLEIAAGSQNEGRRHTLAQIYDETCRKEWSEKAFRGDPGFDVNQISRTKDNELLNRARLIYDSTAAEAGKTKQNHMANRQMSKGQGALITSTRCVRMSFVCACISGSGKGKSFGKDTRKRSFGSDHRKGSGKGKFPKTARWDPYHRDAPPPRRERWATRGVVRMPSGIHFLVLFTRPAVSDDAMVKELRELRNALKKG